MKVATIGTSFITEWFLTAVKLNEGVKCIAIHSRDLEKGKAFALKHNVSKVYCDLDEMLADTEIDTVYVASPNSLHFEYSLKVIQSGKNVICEKPFTTTKKELELLKEAAKKYNVFLFEAIVTLHTPNYQMIKNNISQLGKIHMVQCNFSQYSSRYNQFLENKNPNIFSPKFSGGALYDLNIYNLHFTVGIFGRPNAIHYYPNKADNGIDTSGVLILNYDGFSSVCVACKDSKSHNIAQIQGEKGYIAINSETSKCAEFSINVGDISNQPGVKQIEPTLYYELGEFIKIIDRKDYEECYRLLDHSLLVMELLEEARKDAGIVFDRDHAILPKI